jgi:N-methylhydantoinase A
VTEIVRPWRIGVDIGGTFTDGILWNQDSGYRGEAKVLSTTDDLSRGFLEVVERLLDENGVATAELGYLVHGTTIATNAVLERRLASTAYVTTAGFRDVFEIARQVRPDPHDIFTVKPPPLVPRNLCFEVRERTSAEGEILVPLDEDDVRRVAGLLRDANVAAVAVCLLHSYAAPANERRVAEILADELPGVLVSASSDLVAEFREYPRACTVAINAGLVPIVAEYLDRIERHVRTLGFAGELRVMQSNGGVLALEEARAKPVHILESGPAAGVMGAVHVGELAATLDLISFDMGGTTAKLGLVRGGEPSMTQEFEVGETSRSRSWFTGASGYPILVPSVDLVEIGAGGGSIAWVDSGGMLRVGPRSAGSQPGPACYGRGGTEPTVTDANLVLGRLSPHGLLAGDLPLDVGAANDAIARVADRIGLSVSDTALGIVEIANVAMVGAMRTVSVQRGYDPRDFVLVAFGGAGPSHALALADEMGMSRVLIQPQPGIASALGLLVTDVRHEFSATRVQVLAQVRVDDLRASFAALEERGRSSLEREGVPDDARAYLRSIEMRYVGQSYQLVVPLEDGPLDEASLGRAVEEFHRLHELVYGYAESSEPTELVNLRVAAVGRIDKPQRLSAWPTSRRHADHASDERRQVCFREHGYVDAPIYRRTELPPGWQARGPAVIEERDSTTLVHPGWTAFVTGSYDLLLSRASGVAEHAADPTAATVSR